ARGVECHRQRHRNRLVAIRRDLRVNRRRITVGADFLDRPPAGRPEDGPPLPLAHRPAPVLTFMLDLVLYNGHVLTQATPSVSSAVGVRAGRIAVVGDTDAVMREAGSSSRKIDLAGRTVVPGFNDAHAHIWKIGHLLTTMLDLRGAGGFEL